MEMIIPLSPGGGPPEMGRPTRQVAPGVFEAVAQQNRVRDAREVAMCSHCGSAREGLQLCGGCRSLWFCGKECLAAAWKGGHKQECPKLKARREAEKKAAKAGGGGGGLGGGKPQQGEGAAAGSKKKGKN